MSRIEIVVLGYWSTSHVVMRDARLEAILFGGELGMNSIASISADFIALWRFLACAYFISILSLSPFSRRSTLWETP